MVKNFQIGKFCFQIISQKDIPIPEHFLLFEVSGSIIPQFTYRIFLNQVGSLPEEVLTARENMVVYKAEGGEGRLLGTDRMANVYAYYRENKDASADIFVEEAVMSQRIDTVFTSLFALERRLIRQRGLILHCAYLEHQGKGILFSAPSGVGKSTQAALWERYRNSRVVNGDRALLRKENGKWIACGWPVCGSSEICRQADTPIHAIVMLQQGKENQVTSLSPAKAFSLLYPQITVNPWNSDFVRTAMNSIEDLVLQVPVWHLTCDISEEAVVCLERNIFSNNFDSK